MQNGDWLLILYWTKLIILCLSVISDPYIHTLASAVHPGIFRPQEIIDQLYSDERIILYLLRLT